MVPSRKPVPAHPLARGRGPLAGFAALALATCALVIARAPRPATPRALAAGASPTLPITATPIPGSFVERLDVVTFRKGNVHTHSTWSDGDHHPADVYTWYRRHGYAFLVMTDHNSLTDPALFKYLERAGKFVIVPGEEITMYVDALPVHVNAICHRRAVGGGRFPTVAEALSFAVGETLAQGGVALINHPNFEWALSAREISAARGARLLEIWSGHPHTRSAGDAEHPSAEHLWDEALSAGVDYAAVAVDDMHHLEAGADDHDKAAPGRAWIEVFSTRLDAGTLCADIQRGRLYASTGPELRRLVLDESVMTVEVDGDCLVEFVGAGGRVLGSVRAAARQPATYRLTGGETYVRARITGADGKRAWTQAYRVK